MQNTYIIGEIGQNHNGSVDIAKLIIELVTRPVREELFGIELKPMDAIKLTRRDLKKEMTASQMNKAYESPNSFGKTYGEHRAFLELDDSQHHEIFKYAKSRGLDVVETICAIGALSLLKQFYPDYIKVASRDLTNLPLLAALAETKVPMIVSTGMGGKSELDEALNVITKYHSEISILHCVSEYPTQPKNANLKSISYLLKHYGKYTIGYSDHTIGLSAPVAAVAIGAKIIEKHITIDRQMKGTDHPGSLGPDGINRMIRDIRLTEMSMGKEDIFSISDIEEARRKLERSIASKSEIKKGSIISQADLHLLSPGDGVKWIDRDEIIDKKAVVDIPENEIIYKNMVK
jgi:sialic acid synthase SpsE